LRLLGQGGAAPVLRELGELLLPSRCALCTRILPVQPRRSPPTPRDLLCRECRGAGWSPPAPPVGADLGGELRIAQLGAHSGALRDLILRAKWAGAEELIPPLGAWLAERCVLTWGSPCPVDAVVPIPRSLGRRLRLGRPLSETLALAVAQRLRRPCRALLRRSGGPPQVGLDREARRRAPFRALRARTGRGWRGERLLLVDDVLTTGTTLRAAEAILRAGGARSVHIAVLASSPSDGPEERAGDGPEEGRGAEAGAEGSAQAFTATT